MDLDFKKTAEKIVIWIRETARNAGFKRIVIAISGGIDSALALNLCVKALGKENVYVLFLPYGELNVEGVRDAQLICDLLKINEENRILIDIKNAVGEIFNFIKNDKNNNIRKGNIMARIRMIYLFDKAKELKALVCGTENKSENLLGYFTRFGDQASDLEPIACLYKTQIWQMAKCLNLPLKIRDKAPTAGLWVGQTDEEELGFSYKTADQILYFYFDKKLMIKEIIKKGFKKEEVEKVLKKVKENKFKTNLPYIFNI